MSQKPPFDLVSTAFEREYSLRGMEPLWRSGTGAASERREAYLRDVPYPFVTFARIDKSGPISGYSPGLEAVWGYRHEFASDTPEVEKRVLWRWEPPDDIRMRYPAWAGRRGKERHWFLCLYTPPSERGWEYDPVILCFDAASGLRWRVPLPVVSEPGIDLPPVAKEHRAHFRPSPDVRVHIGSTPDGERVVALVYPYPDRDMTWMYILDGYGRVTRSLVVPDRHGVDNTLFDGHV